MLCTQGAFNTSRGVRTLQTRYQRTIIHIHNKYLHTPLQEYVIIVLLENSESSLKRLRCNNYSNNEISLYAEMKELQALFGENC